MAGDARRGPRRLLAVAMAISACGLLWWGVRGRGETEPRIHPDDWAIARRIDLETSLVVGGELQPAKEVFVSCQVEDLAREGGALIVSMIDNGAHVKKGDELCRLDSSALEEVARQQEIRLVEAQSTWNQARLALEVAQTALREYADGKVITQTKEYEGKIALAESDGKRQEDRLIWTEAMREKGYVSQGQVLSDRQVLEQSRHDLRKTRGELDLFLRLTIPKEVAGFEKEIRVAEKNLEVESKRLKHEEERLANCRKQIGNCVVRAPSDGVAIHAKYGGWWSPPLQPGERVYQEQRLFMLPDLSQMEVEISIHETMGPRVQVGMSAKVRIASIPDRVLSAKVVKMDRYPVQNEMEWDDTLKHYVARVRLDQTPPRILPMMSAVVEIDTGRVENALVIPVEAMSVVDGHRFCRVLAPGGRVANRPIAVRNSTPQLLEVIDGLAEGDRVLMAGAVVPSSSYEPSEYEETGWLGLIAGRSH